MKKRRASSASEIEELRELCKKDLFTFAQVIQPLRVYGQVHKDMCEFLTKPDAKDDQLCLIPRAHMKSHIIAVWCAWKIYNNPETTILYVSATASLAESQLYAIKTMIDSPEFKLLSPEMIKEDEGKRQKWSSTQIMVDHPIRIAEGVRDPTIEAVGLSSNMTGKHADIMVYDDVVVPDNAYTEDGRTKVAAALSQCESIKNPGGISKAVGTRYHAKDQYSIWLSQMVEVFDDDDNVIGEEPVWEVMERVVEENGIFTWPRERRADGKAFGFDLRTLAKIKTKYTDRTQFYAQYYNDPNDPENQRIDYESFQYYDKSFLRNERGDWYFKDKRLNVYAAVDFAFTIGKTSDYTAIVVIGISSDGDIYVLDIDRFQTDRISVYFKHIARMHSQWGFRKLRAEVVSAQAIIIRDLKDYIKREGMSIAIDEYNPRTNKEERIAATLEPRYDNKQIWHFKGGYTPVLEEEVVQPRPTNDDVKDALASAIDIAVKPMAKKDKVDMNMMIRFNSRFGGVG